MGGEGIDGWVFNILRCSPLPVLEVPGPSLGRLSGGVSRSFAATPSIIASRDRLPSCTRSLSSSSDMLEGDSNGWGELKQSCLVPLGAGVEAGLAHTHAQSYPLLRAPPLSSMH